MSGALANPSLTFSSGLITEITSINHSGASREMVDTSSFDTVDWKTFIADDLADPGQLDIEFYLDPSAAYYDKLFAAVETVTIAFADGSTLSSSGGMTDFGFDQTRGQAGTASISIKLSGEVTFTAAGA